MKLLYITLLMVATTATYAQNSAIITGKVYDEQQQAIELVNIKLVETNQYSITKSDGSFSIVTSGNKGQDITLELSYIGFQTITRVVSLRSDKIDLGNIQMKTLDLSLKEISVNAKRNYQGSTNSSLMIGRDMIEQIPALSLNDLLNQIPNRKISSPSLQNVQTITLRSTYEGTVSGRDPFALSNSFGVAIIMDGQAISNNANMQSYNPGIRGLSGSNVNSASGWGLNGTGTRSYSGDYAFGGTDLRQIPVDNIESIEVISGVPSAKYGDLTDGAIVIERQAGFTPAYLRMQLRDNATSYSLSKGFKLSKEMGALNLGFNYVNSFADNRDKLKAYRRITGNAMWTNTFGIRKQIKNTFSLDYGQNLDGIKQDPDDPLLTRTRFDSWNFSVGNRTSYRLSGDFLKNIGLNLKYSEGHQQTYTSRFVNDPYVLYSDAITTGVAEGTYDTGIYEAISQVDGRPVNLSARLDLNAEFNTGNLVHYLSFGTSLNYSVNRGLGQQSDPKRPRGTIGIKPTTSLSNNSERYYDFKLAIAQKDLGLYLEDLFKFKLFGKDLNVRSGVRFEVQNGFVSLAPRTNANYQLNDHIRMGLAYGIAFKSPGLAHRYPGPTFMETPLLNSYNGNMKESIYLLYVERYDPTNKNLKSSKNQTMEFTTQFKLHDFDLSVSAFHKIFNNGINTREIRKIVTLPVYNATFRPGQQPEVTVVGDKRYLMKYFAFENNLRSNSSGVELILTTPEIPQIATSFNISGGIFKTKYFKEGLTPGLPTEAITNKDPKYGISGMYEPDRRTSYLSNGRITATTHIPKISLIAQFTAEFSLIDKTIRSPTAGIPVAYYTNDLSYVEIPNFNPQDPYYGHLYKPTEEINQDNVPKIISNYHFSIGKEIKKRFKFSFNVNNIFNYQPSYTTSSGSLIYPNSLPTFGAELSLKL